MEGRGEVCTRLLLRCQWADVEAIKAHGILQQCGTERVAELFPLLDAAPTSHHCFVSASRCKKEAENGALVLGSTSKEKTHRPWVLRRFESCRADFIVP